jgi:hypothetical protein
MSFHCKIRKYVNLEIDSSIHKDIPWADFVAKFSFIAENNALFWNCFSSRSAQSDSFLIVCGFILFQATFFTGSVITYFGFFGKYSGNGGGPQNSLKRNILINKISKSFVHIPSGGAFIIGGGGGAPPIPGIPGNGGGGGGPPLPNIPGNGGGGGGGGPPLPSIPGNGGGGGGGAPPSVIIGGAGGMRPVNMVYFDFFSFWKGKQAEDKNKQKQEKQISHMIWSDLA